MAYCLTGSGQTNPSGSPTDSSNFCQNIWGSSSSDATSYSISDVYAGQIIDNAKFNDIGVKVNQERSRRGHGSRSYSFSGVIDWECSQFGEVDFELSHLIHWCLYPPDPSINLRPFLKSVIRQLPYSKKVPDLETRLTIYQIEHDINQIVWSNGEVEADRFTRIEGWLNGAVGDLLSSL